MPLLPVDVRSRFVECIKLRIDIEIPTEPVVKVLIGVGQGMGARKACSSGAPGRVLKFVAGVLALLISLEEMIEKLADVAPLVISRIFSVEPPRSQSSSASCSSAYLPLS